MAEILSMSHYKNFNSPEIRSFPNHNMLQFSILQIIICKINLEIIIAYNLLGEVARYLSNNSLAIYQSI